LENQTANLKSKGLTGQSDKKELVGKGNQTQVGLGKLQETLIEIWFKRVKVHLFLINDSKT